MAHFFASSIQIHWLCYLIFGDLLLVLSALACVECGDKEV